MASICNLHYFLNSWLPVWLLAPVWIMTCTFSVTEGSDLIQLSGEVGGNVTFHCPFAKEKAIRFFYLQKDTSPILFVNGYYGDNDTGKQYTIERMKLKNTELNLSDRTVYMDGLNISHSGVYECIISYNDKGNTESSKIHLSVTARYSKPTVTMSCNGENLGCLVTCASHGGYPSTKMTWNVAENASNQIWNIVNNSEVPSPDTMMFSSSSTAYFNCSYRKPLNYLSCSVGEISSDMFSVCSNQKKRCGVCGPKMDRKTQYTCIKCKTYICNMHSR